MHWTLANSTRPSGGLFVTLNRRKPSSYARHVGANYAWRRGCYDTVLNQSCLALNFAEYGLLESSVTDCLIVGGGVVGLSLAYELAGRGLAITLIDHQEVGREASWAGAGMLPPGSWYTNHPVMEELASFGGELNRQWSQQLLETTGIDNEWNVCGGAYVASSDEQMALFATIFDRWSRRGIQVESIDATRLTDLEPSLGTLPQQLANIRGGYYLPEEGQLRNPRHMRALLQGCLTRGVRVSAPCRITELQATGGLVQGVTTDQGTIACDQILLAAGAWSSRLAKIWGFSLPVRPVRGQIILYPPQPSPLFKGNVHLDTLYAVQRRDGRLLVGATVEEAGFDKSTTTAGIRSLQNWATKVCPPLEHLTCERQWAGLRPASSDGLPYIGLAPRYSNLWVAAGHYRAGIQFAAVTAQVLADRVTGQPSPFDLHPFRLDR